jgi:cob(I)alamin adenosyltransferase
MGMDAIEHRGSGGLVHVYTGNGKGKTTAAIGLAVRAAGAGGRVFFAQCLKGRPSSELSLLRELTERITVRRFGGCNFVTGQGTSHDLAEAARGLAAGCRAVRSRQYRLVVLDEINLAVAMGLVPIQQVLDLMDMVSGGTTLALTGRYAAQPLLDNADLVTDMVEVKHYHCRGVQALVGIDA